MGKAGRKLCSGWVYQLLRKDPAGIPDPTGIPSPTDTVSYVSFPKKRRERIPRWVETEADHRCSEGWCPLQSWHATYMQHPLWTMQPAVSWYICFFRLTDQRSDNLLAWRGVRPSSVRRRDFSFKWASHNGIYHPCKNECCSFSLKAWNLGPKGRNWPNSALFQLRTLISPKLVHQFWDFSFKWANAMVSTVPVKTNAVVFL